LFVTYLYGYWIFVQNMAQKQCQKNRIYTSSLCSKSQQQTAFQISSSVHGFTIKGFQIWIFFCLKYRCTEERFSFWLVRKATSRQGLNYWIQKSRIIHFDLQNLMESYQPTHCGGGLQDFEDYNVFLESHLWQRPILGMCEKNCLMSSHIMTALSANLIEVYHSFP
jgi:hypothetical protein